MKIALNDFLYKKNRQQQIKGFYYVARYHSISQAARAMNLLSQQLLYKSSL